MSHYIKCPDCGNADGYQYLEDKRRRFRCHSCGLDTYLKLIASYAKDETPEHKRQSIETES